MTIKMLTDVVYAPARHAKEVKTELESLEFLDKRYKMVKAKNNGAGNANDVVLREVLWLYLCWQWDKEGTNDVGGGRREEAVEVQLFHAAGRRAAKHGIFGSFTLTIVCRTRTSRRMSRRRGAAGGGLNFCRRPANFTCGLRNLGDCKSSELKLDTAAWRGRVIFPSWVCALMESLPSFLVQARAIERA